MGDASADEFDQYNLSEFNDDEFVAVDAVVLSLSPTPDLGASTSASTRVEAPADSPQKNARQYATKSKSKNRKKRKRRKTDERVDETGASPFARYRERRGTLSVSDLVGPSWCEVQFDYGLRQGRKKNLAERPSSFVTAAGKTITVERKVAKKNDRIQRRGSAIHKKLERELRPEDIEVTVDTETERWALKLIQMNACLDDLLTHGFCREMPVFGVLHERIVTGIIDEIASRPLSEDSARTPSTKNAWPSNGKHQQTSLTSYFASTSHQPAPSRELHLSDSKTRLAPSLPSDEDAQPARLQLMLYHRLLAQVLDPRFDWAAFWTRVGVNASAPLSDTFLKQTFLVQSVASESSDARDATESTKSKKPDDVYVGFPRTLDDLVDALRPTADAVTGSTVNISSTLEIVYRAQHARRRPKPWRRAQEAAEAGLRDFNENEDTDLQRAIAASLADHAGDMGASGMGASFDSVMPSLDAIMPPLGASLERNAHSAGPVQVNSHLGRTLDSALGEMAWAAQEAAVSRVGDAQVDALSQTREAEDVGARAVDYLRASAAEDEGEASAKPLLGRAAEDEAAESEHSEDDVVAEDTGRHAGRIIGRRTFEMDEGELDAHLHRVLGWWMGEREPEGVPVELSRRCFSCEYRDGCEWREAKAREIAERFGVIYEEGSHEHESASESSGDETDESEGLHRRKAGVDVVASMF
ncbi:unnamed protein product [Peniophora sp. CBMAI 1063]|nr:unnamed protein product [Peniophora sp. CBMAI 1063]